MVYLGTINIFNKNIIQWGEYMRESDLVKLKKYLYEIKDSGWIRNQRPGNVGGVGNTLEDLLDVAENNMQLPDFGEWELKSQRAETTSLLTLFHSEPLPRASRIVPSILLPKYGWPHQEAGYAYPSNESSFRQTINAVNYSDRGFKVNVNRYNEIIFIDFDFSRIDSRHAIWRDAVFSKVGSRDIQPNPYWTFNDLSKKLIDKLNNLMYVKAETKKVNGIEYFKYNEFEVYIDPTLERFIDLIEDGHIYVDFDARTGHNHGTKFRIKSNQKNNLYQYCLDI